MRGFFRRCSAALFSLLVAGSGQLFNRQPKKALAILVSLPTFDILVGKFRLTHTFRGLVIVGSMEILFLAWLIADSATFGGPRAKERAGFFQHRTVYLSAILLIVVNAIGAGTNFYRNTVLSGIGARFDPSDGMAPTIQAGDRFVADMHVYRYSLPRRGDVILFRRYEPRSGTEDFVKRVIGVGGDTIEGKGGRVYVNGQQLKEPYARYSSSPPAYDSKRDFGPVTVSADTYFVMGDNRDDSYDSRWFGTIPLSDIEGRILYLYWSRQLSRVGQPVR
jgi:signal peptidase I